MAFLNVDFALASKICMGIECGQLRAVYVSRHRWPGGAVSRVAFRIAYP